MTSKSYYAANKDRILESQRKYREKNREKVRLYDREQTKKLTDEYVKEKITQRSLIKRENITTDMIKRKRAELIVSRLKKGGLPVGIKIRKKHPNKDDWWIFISKNKKRRSIKIGKNKKVAERIAHRIWERIILCDFDIKQKIAKQDLDYQTFLEIKDMEKALVFLRQTITRKKEHEK